VPQLTRKLTLDYSNKHKFELSSSCSDSPGKKIHQEIIEEEKHEDEEEYEPKFGLRDNKHDFSVNL